MIVIFPNSEKFEQLRWTVLFCTHLFQNSSITSHV